MHAIVAPLFRGTALCRSEYSGSGAWAFCRSIGCGVEHRVAANPGQGIRANFRAALKLSMKPRCWRADQRTATGRTCRFDESAANDRNRRNLAVRTRPGEGLEATPAATFGL